MKPFLSALALAALVAMPAAAADKAAKPVKSGVDPATAKKLAEVRTGPTAEHPSFAVDMVMEYEGEKMTMRRIVDHDRTRMDMKAKGQTFSQIQLNDEAGTTYMLMHDEKRAMKQTRATMEKMIAKQGGKVPEKVDTQAVEAEGRASVELLGREKIDGVQTDKYKVATPEGDGLMWVDAEKNLPVRMEAQGSKVDFKNYDFEPQPASVFEVPKGYEVMDMDEMMKKMPAGMGAMGMGMAGGMAKGYAGQMGGQMGGSLGASFGAAVGGPIGAMIGQYVGSKIGEKVGTAAAGAVLPGK